MVKKHVWLNAEGWALAVIGPCGTLILCELSKAGDLTNGEFMGKFIPLNRD